MTTLKAEVSYLRKDVYYLKSTNFTSLFDSAEDQDAPTNSKMPPANTEDVPMEYMTVDESGADG